MERLIIVSALILIGTISVYSQSLKDISSNDKLVIADSSDYVFSFRVKPVYTSVQNSKSASYYGDGFGVTFSVQYDIGKMFSAFFDVNTSSIKYTEKVKEQYPPVYIDKGNQSSNMVVAGVKLYAMKPQYPMYLKAGIGILVKHVIPPVLNFGIGYEYKLSRTFNLFFEGEADYYSGFMEAPSMTYLSVGIGASIYIGNFEGKW